MISPRLFIRDRLISCGNIGLFLRRTMELWNTQSSVGALWLSRKDASTMSITQAFRSARKLRFAGSLIFVSYAPRKIAAGSVPIDEVACGGKMSGVRRRRSTVSFLISCHLFIPPFSPPTTTLHFKQLCLCATYVNGNKVPKLGSSALFHETPIEQEKKIVLLQILPV